DGVRLGIDRDESAADRIRGSRQVRHGLTRAHGDGPPSLDLLHHPTRGPRASSNHRAVELGSRRSSISPRMKGSGCRRTAGQIPRPETTLPSLDSSACSGAMIVAFILVIVVLVRPPHILAPAADRRTGLLARHGSNPAVALAPRGLLGRRPSLADYVRGRRPPRAARHRSGPQRT